MDNTLTTAQIDDAVQRLGGHLLRAVAATSRNTKVINAGFTLPR